LGATESFDMQVELSQSTTTWPRQIRSYAEYRNSFTTICELSIPNGSTPTVINGRGDELVDLAKVNLFR
jgi:hypothetical protein